jgi:hypothetical protein
MLFRETITVDCNNHTKHGNILCGENVELYDSMLKQVVRAVTTGLLRVKICPEPACSPLFLREGQFMLPVFPV